MNDIFDFGENGLDDLLESLNPGQQLKASLLLAQLEMEGSEVLEAVFAQLEEKKITLVLDDIPLSSADPQTLVRLRQEAKLVKEGDLVSQLEQTDPLRLYLEELAAIPACGDLQALALSLHDPDEAVMGQIMNLCLSRVVELAAEYAGKGVLLLDLIQEGSMGLWQGLISYAGQPIEDYRDHCIRNAMTKAVIAQAYEAGVGQHLRQAMEDYRSVDERLLTELGTNPTIEQIAQSMHMTPAQAAVVADMVENARFVSRAKNPEQTRVMAEEEDQAVEDTAYFQMRQRITELLSALDEKDAQLLTLRYGLEGGAPMTPEQTAAKLGMTAQEVIAGESAALTKLRTK